MGNKDLEYNLFLVSGCMFSLRYPDPSRAPVAPASGGALTAAARIAGIGEGTWVFIWGAFVGIGFLIVSRCTKEALGYADSWMIFLLGMYLGIWKLVSALSFSFLAAGIWSLGKVVLKKKGRKEVIPFLPFLTAGYLGGIVW